MTGSTRITFPERTITSKPKYGTKIKVNTPTHIAGTLDFANGAVGTIITTFDVWGSRLPNIEIHGTEGTSACRIPTHLGARCIRRAGEKEWSDVPLTHSYVENSRGLGVADMALSLRTGRPHRANGALAYHVLDCMHAFQEASESERHVRLSSSCERPDPLPMGLRVGQLTRS